MDGRHSLLMGDCNRMTASLRVLMVEDSERDARLLLRHLHQGGYEVTSERVESAAAMSAALVSREWDLIICDYSLPQFNGTAALHLLKEHGLDVPFIFFSGTIGEEAAVTAMRLGAQDYIMKGDMARLLPAIQRELREAHVRRERRRAEEALRQSEIRYRTLIKNAAYGIFLSTREGRFVEVNPALATMLCYESEAELLETGSERELYCNPSDREELFQQMVRRGGLAGIEVAWRRKDGRPLTVRFSSRTVTDEISGDVLLECIVEDMTERTALEEQVRQLQKFESIGQLAGGIAHDFNNVIGAISGWAELATRESPDGPVRNKLEKIRAQAQKAGALTRQLLAFARRQILERKNLDLNSLTREFIGLLGFLGSHIEVQTKLAPNLGTVRADPSQIEQVLMNLVVNARDAMPSGGRLHIETQNVYIDENFCHAHVWARVGSYVRLSVSDTGVGMSPETLAHAFEPFFTTKEVDKGTGLGLATVYGIVKQHEGFVHVYSELDLGTTFRVYLPMSAGTPEALQKPDNAIAAGGTEAILVVEDHEALRELAEISLEGLGYQVIVAANGLEGVKAFQENRQRIALVLMDVVMPKLAGPEAASQILQIRPDMRVVFTTGYSQETELIESLLGAGAHFLQKPYSTDALAAKVREVLDRRENQKEDLPL